MTPIRKDASYGMTLIEILVAASIMAVIAVSLWSAVGQTARTRDIVEESHSKLHQVRVAFDLISKDLSSAYLSLHRAPNEPTHDTLFIGEDHGGEDRIDFYSFSHKRRYFNANESDQAEISCLLADDPEISGQQNLVRRSSPVLDLEPFEGGQYLIIVENVDRFELEYFDLAMNQWQDEWDTTQALEDAGLLPFQIRMRLVVFDRNGEKVSYGTQLPIPMRSAILRQGFTPGPPIPVTR